MKTTTEAQTQQEMAQQLIKDFKEGQAKTPEQLRKEAQALMAEAQKQEQEKKEEADRLEH